MNPNSLTLMETFSFRDRKVESLRTLFQTSGWGNVGAVEIFTHCGKSFVINGNHRVIAARQAGLTHIPTIEISVSQLRSYGYTLERLVYDCAE